MPNFDFTSPGAAFSGGLEDYLMKQRAIEHQNMLDDLANKREQRLAQAELDSHAERQDALAQKKIKDTQDIHDKQVKDLEKRAETMVAGDRPDPEMVKQAQSLGLAGMFRTAPPTMSTETMQPPAALMEAPPAGAPAEGAELPTPAGAMAPGPTTYPGSPQERLADQQRLRQKAFIDAMPDTDPRKQELKTAFEAEAAGLKVPTGYFSKTGGAATKHRVIFDPAKGEYRDAVTHQPVTDASDLENAQVDRLAEPKDHSARDAAAQNHIDTVREHAYAEFKDAMKPLRDRIDRADKIEVSLGQNTDVADSTIAEQLVTLTAGGQGSGIRISQPMIDQVLSKSRNKWDDFSQALKRWESAPPDQKGNIGLFFTPEQRQGIRDLGRAYRAEAVKASKKILDYRSKIDNASTIAEINNIRTKAEADLLGPSEDAAPKPKRTAEQILKDAGL